jgi:8-amino-7-oxononanoate synthase
MAPDHVAADDTSGHWRAALNRQLAAIPASRRRALRPFQPAESTQTDQLDGSTASLLPTSPTGQAQSRPPHPLLDLASNDYLGLSRHPAVVAAAQAAAAREGTGAGASRLVSGSRPIHTALESALAAWLGRERVLLFPSGFQANLAAVTALADRHSLVLADRLIHHSLLTGVRACGARLQRFAHNDLADLQARLQAARRSAPQQRLLVLSESLFSMEGTSPDVAALAALCAHHGAALLLDEAHALGVLGPGGRGLGHGVREIALVCGTFGKAFGSGGAFLAGDTLVMEWLLQSSGAFRYTTALAPPLAAAALAALELLQAESSPAMPQPGGALLARAARWRDALAAAGWPRPPGCGPVLPLLVGDDRQALQLQERLEAAGLLAVAIRPPTVPDGTARLRLVLRHDLPGGAGLPDATLERLLQALGPAPAVP